MEGGRIESFYASFDIHRLSYPRSDRSPLRCLQPLSIQVHEFFVRCSGIGCGFCALAAKIVAGWRGSFGGAENWRNKGCQRMNLA